MFLSLTCCFGFCAFGFEAIPYPSCYLFSIVDKTHHGQLLLLFLCNFCRFFSYVGGVLVINLFSLLLIYIFWLSANHSTQGGFVIFFLICSDFLNCLRSVGTIVQQNVAKTTSKSFSLSNSSQKPPFFTVLMYSLYGHPQVIICSIKLLFLVSISLFVAYGTKF